MCQQKLRGLLTKTYVCVATYLKTNNLLGLGGGGGMGVIDLLVGCIITDKVPKSQFSE